jgi:hypothetical protein
MSARRFLVIVMVVFVVVGLMVPAVLADSGGNPDANACFGQFRALGAHMTKAAGLSLGWLITKYNGGDVPQAGTVHWIQDGNPVFTGAGLVAPCG